jgi:hypothetical protein
VCIMTCLNRHAIWRLNAGTLCLLDIAFLPDYSVLNYYKVKTFVIIYMMGPALSREHNCSVTEIFYKVPTSFLDY